MADFGLALPYLINDEVGSSKHGGFTNIAEDRGGPTCWGITEKLARAYGYTGAMYDLPFTLASTIYLKEFWRFNGLLFQPLATKLLDEAANLGLATTVRLAQEAANALGASLAVDGHYGPQTEATLNAVDGARMLQVFCSILAAHYRGIVAGDPTQAKFLQGWLNRAAEVPNG